MIESEGRLERLLSHMKGGGSGSTKRLIALVILILLGGLAAMQLIPLRIENPPVTAEFKAPPEVKQVLKKSCYNCHSSQTLLPWSDRVAPAYWIMATEIR